MPRHVSPDVFDAALSIHFSNEKVLSPGLLEAEKELEGEEAYFGELIVRSHRFNASTTIGRWLLAKGMGDTFSQSAWASRGWPSYGAIVSDLIDRHSPSP